jgi:cytoplasmic FMR1 interacting protein
MEQALLNVSVLGGSRLPCDQPSIEAAGISLDCDTNFDTNFVDREGFVRGIAKYIEEARAIGSLNEVLEEGEAYAGTLYTWRSCSRAIPQVSSNEQANRKEMYEAQMKVLDPEAQKLKDFYAFQERAIKSFTDEIRTLANPARVKDFISQTTKLTLGRLVNMFMVLDALKNMKACLSNDFAFWKRADGFLNSGSGAALNPDAIMQSQKLGVFLATQNSVTDALIMSLRGIENYELVLAEVVTECATLFEKGMYILPDEKHQLLKTMAFGLYLMDNPDPKKTIYKNKLIDVKRFDKIFKQLPVVPLFGDMQITLMSYIQKSGSWEANQSHWVSGTDRDEARVAGAEYNLLGKIGGFKAERDRLLCALRLSQTGDGEQGGEKMLDLAIRAIRTLSRWTATVKELYAWKLAHPMDKYKNHECTDDKEPYEKAAKYNYNAEEKTAFIEMIAMIKDVSKTLWQMQIRIDKIVRRDMYREIQTFIQITLRDAIRHSVKKKHRKAETVLMGLRSTCADWLNGLEPADDPALKGKKDTKFVIKPIPNRTVGPGSTQLFMLRTMLESLCADTKKKSLMGDIESKDLPALQAFYQRSYDFRWLLNYNECIQKAGDLSQLWYREFFLELTMGQMIQFPIEMSMPFVMIDHILTSRDPSMIEFVLYPLDLYNDAADFALTSLKKQYLYDEVEAEVDLAFDQFIVRLSQEIYTHYKTRASTIMLSSRFKSECAQSNFVLDEQSEHRYSTVLSQTSFQLLGRSVDISRLLCQRLNVELRTSLDLAIRKLESRDLAHIHVYEDLLENNRLTHSLLSEQLKLDPFEEMLAEKSGSVNNPILNRVTMTIFAEICTDVIPNFAFNSGSQRFVRPAHAPEFGDGEPQREKAPSSKSMYLFGNRAMDKTFNAIHARKQGFVGKPHFDCIARLLTYGSLAFLIDEALKVVTESIKMSLAPFVHALTKGMPKQCKLPLFDYGSAGMIGFYQMQLKDIMQYSALQTDVFHSFREIGNGVLVFLMLEKSVSTKEVLDLAQAMPFQGMIPAVVKEGEDREKKIAQAQNAAKFMRYSDHLQALQDPYRQNLGQAAASMTQNRISKGFSIFTAVLGRIKKCLEEATVATGEKPFVAPPPTNTVMDVDECNQFHRLWSAIMYTSAIICAQSHMDSHQTYFGDGLLWAGCTIISLLNQSKRHHAFDFCNHIIAAWDIDQNSSDVAGINIRNFVQLARGKRTQSSEIYSILDKYLKSPEFAVQPTYFPPPNDVHDAETAV